MQPPTDAVQDEIRALRERLAANPDSYCFASLADLYLQAEQPDEALATARAGVARHPGFAAGHLVLARVCRQQGLHDEALQALAVVTAAVPESLEAQRMLAELSRQAGRHQEALSALRTAREFHPDDQALAAEYADLELLFPPGVPVGDDVEELELIELSDDDMILEDVGTGGEEPAVELAVPPVVRKTDPWSVAARQSQKADELFDEAPSFDEDVAADFPSGAVTGADDPMLTPTVAELYLTQGFADRARDIYRALHERNPDDAAVAARLAELEDGSPVDAPEEAGGAESLSDDDRQKVAVLEGWLENIRRMRP